MAQRKTAKVAEKGLRLRRGQGEGSREGNAIFEGRASREGKEGARRFQERLRAAPNNFLIFLSAFPFRKRGEGTL